MPDNLRSLLKARNIFMQKIDKLGKEKYQTELELGKLNSKIRAIQDDNKANKINRYLKKHPLKCQHEPGNEYHCARDDCSGGHRNCNKCGARRLNQIIPNVWVTDEESTMLYKRLRF